MRLTHVGTATVLLEIGSHRLLTDPALDPAGRRYSFRPGLSSMKTEEPAVPKAGIEPVDVVLLSHDHHADNLDDAGRALLPRCGCVLTTMPAALRLGGNARALPPWVSWTRDGLRITAVPARHGPPGIELVDSVTTGFVLEWPGQKRGALYISGDTVYFGGIAEIARRFQIGTAILHLGGVRFPLTGPLRYTFTAQGAARAAVELGKPVVIPVHYGGWRHFREPRSSFEAAFSGAGLDVRWLPRGEPIEIDV
jgi:L-ascorbate metabolism protein UlaG (beta-lactamase superfamily)